MSEYGNTHHTEGDTALEEVVLDVVATEYYMQGYDITATDATALTWLRLYQLTPQALLDMGAQFEEHARWHNNKEWD